MSKDITEDPAYPKVQFPSKDLCPLCYDSQNQLEESKVLDFLLSFYSAKNMLQVNQFDKGLSPQKTGSIFDKFQISKGFYFVLFLISLIGLMLLFIGVRKTKLIAVWSDFSSLKFLYDHLNDRDKYLDFFLEMIEFKINI